MPPLFNVSGPMSVVRFKAAPPDAAKLRLRLHGSKQRPPNAEPCRQTFDTVHTTVTSFPTVPSLPGPPSLSKLDSVITGSKPIPRVLRTAEMLVVFALLPGALIFVPGRIVLPAIWVAGGLCLVWLLRDPAFDRRTLLVGGADWPQLRRVLLLCLMATIALVVLAVIAAPNGLFAFPRERPFLWVLVALLYPLLSVYAQELVFRAFFFHRYEALLGTTGVCWASALAFGWAHVVLRNVPALVLSAAGGYLFSVAYARSRSLGLAWLAHSLLGDVVFTVGLGAYFFDGMRAAPGRWRF